ncbi:MAG: NACHT domain-containing protein [Pseudonocardiaceae bacterium]
MARWWDRRSQRGVWVAAALVTGAVTLLILLFGGASLAAKWAPVATVIVSVLGLLVSMGRGNDDEDSRADRTARLSQAAEELASAVREQLLTEARIRRLQDPEPLKVRWAMADSPLADHWENVVRSAEDPTPADLAGRLDGIVEIFARVPSRRMVVLGRPGAGKSVLAIRFTLDILARRGPGEPVPVIFPVSTWDPARDSLHGWLAERLVADFGSLGSIISPGRTVVSELLGSRRVLPVLDGLDELSGELCGMAVRRLNAELDEDAPILVTCRTEAYAEIVASCDVLTSTLAVELLPLTLEESGRYLERTARRLPTGAGTPSKTIWSPVLRHLQRHPHDPGAAALREVLSTPLMTAMARSVYSDPGRDPAELLQERFSSPAPIEEHLLDAFIPAVFGETVTDGEDRGKPAWTADQARRWLGFLAGHLERRNTVNLAWWELETALPTLLRRLAPGLLAGCIAVIVLALFLPYVLINQWRSGTVVESGALVVGGVTGLTVGLTLLGRHRMARTPPGPTRQNDQFLRYQVAMVLVMAVFLGAAMGASADLTFGLRLAHPGGYLLQGLLAGAAISVIFGIVGVSDLPVPLAVPWAGRARRRPPAWRISAAVVSFLFGYFISQLTSIDNIAGGFFISALAGAVLGVAAWFWTGVRQLTPAVVARSSRRPMLRRLHREFSRGLLRCFAIGLLFGLTLGTVGGVVAGWRAETNEGFPAGSTVTTASDMTRFTKDHDGWTYSVALDGTKTVEPPGPVRGMLIVNPHGSGPIRLSDGRSFQQNPPVDRWIVDPKGRGPWGPELCHNAPVLCYPLLMKHVLIQSKDGRVTIRLNAGQVVEGHNLAGSISRKAVDWFGERTFQQLLLKGLQVGLLGGLTLGGVGGVACGLYRWLETPADITRSTSPILSLRTDRVAALTRGGLVAVLSGLVCFTVALTTPDVDGSRGLTGQLWLLMGPVAVCLSAWGRLLVTRIWLGITGRLPWRLMKFLSYVHRRDMLRQSGALYQFRHLRLQQRLAADLQHDGVSGTSAALSNSRRVSGFISCCPAGLSRLDQALRSRLGGRDRF